MKTAIIILSDPKSGSEEALGRVFNALALASECKQKGDEVAVVFNGAGTRWPAELTQTLASGQWPLQRGSRCRARRLMRLCGGLWGDGKCQVLRSPDCEGPCIGRDSRPLESASLHGGGLADGRVLSRYPGDGLTAVS